MAQPFRLDDTRAVGARIDRTQPLSFSFNGREVGGYVGDTIASALLASGQRLVARSFKYHRPRGVFSAGVEEPNALVELRSGVHRTPNTNASVTRLREGLSVFSQNHRGSLAFDLMAINDFLHPFLSAGFYYKTFMWPSSFWERLYEPSIRAAAGLGRLSGKEDDDVYDKGFLHCDVLVIGSGAAGLAAALTAARGGAQVILAEQDFVLGGGLLSEDYGGDKGNVAAWAARAQAELSGLSNVRLMPSTTVFGVYDHGIYGAVQRASGASQPLQVMWRIYARRSVLCAGAIERSIAFANNDRPGIMLASAVRSYLRRYAVTPGRRVAVYSNNSDGITTARALQAAGVEVAAVIDSRKGGAAKLDGVPYYAGTDVVDTRGRKQLRSLILSSGVCVEADCLAVSGGWNPSLHLTCHHRNLPVWNQGIASFVPGEDLPKGMAVAGAAGGDFSLRGALRGGCQAAGRALESLGIGGGAAAADIGEVARACGGDDGYDIVPMWEVASGRKRAFVDLHNDVTSKDIRQAAREGFTAVEHMKRYTTLGMGVEQGKSSGVQGIAILAAATGCSIGEVGTTVYRPPYTGVPIATFAARARGKHFRPYRLPPSHAWAQEQGAVFVEAANWLRAQWFPRAGEEHWRQSVDREVSTVRSRVGVCDVSTLGKIDIKGADAARFLSFIYANSFDKLGVGKVRYGLMLRHDGYAYDDGTVARLASEHFIVTTTTANAGGVYRHMEFVRQCLCPDMDVHTVSITDGVAQFAVAGPLARKLLLEVVDEQYDIGDQSVPYMGCAEVTVCGGVAARLYRISFSGELAYEIAVSARYGDALMRQLMARCHALGGCAYGTEALGVMRIEKGHPAGGELNGQTTAQSLRLGKMLSSNKDFIGAVLARRQALEDVGGEVLVGLLPASGEQRVMSGAHLFASGAKTTTGNDLGWVSSDAYSPTLGSYIALGFLLGGRQWEGRELRAYDPLRGTDTKVRVVSPHFYDPKGVLLRG